MAEYTNIIKSLIERTRDGKISWKPAAGKTFIAALEGEFTFEIESSEDNAFYSFSMSDREGYKIVDLVAEEPDYLSPDRREGDQYYDILKALYQLARWVGLGVEKKLSKAQALLDKF